MKKNSLKKKAKKDSAFLRFLRQNLAVIICGALAIGVTIAVTAVRVQRNSTAVYASAAAVEAAESTAEPEPAAASQPSAEPSPDPTVSPAPSSDELKARLQVYSSELDLSVTVTDENGNAYSGTAFVLDVTDPDGNTRTFSTDDGAHIYLSGLTAGRYTVSMRDAEGFARVSPVSCSVREKLSYTPIVNITQEVEVLEITDVPVEETKPAEVSSYVEPAPADIIISADVEEASTTVETAVTDEKGVLTYSYSYETGEHGYLLLASGEESDVLPEEVDGKLARGLKKVVSYFDSEGASIQADAIAEDAVEGEDYFVEESAIEVTLFNADNTPVSDYMITAEPVYETIEIKTGWNTIDGSTYFYDSDGTPVTGLKNIDGRLYYFNSDGVKTSRTGIDVSYFNSDINWNLVKADGIDFAIIRLAGRTWGSGTLFEDGYSYKKVDGVGMYLQEARAAGLSIGAYVYSNAITPNEAVEEASLAIEILDGMALDFPIYIDMEYSGEYPEGRADKLSIEERNEIVRAFCETIEAAGYRAGVYAGEYYWNTALSYSALSQYSIWYANYLDVTKAPVFTGWNIWQFSAYGSVNGSPGYNDLNIIY